MELEFKPDFEQVRSRWQSFWEGTNTRPMVSGIRRKQGSDPEWPAPYAVAFGDIKAEIKKTVSWMAAHEYLADAIPFRSISFAPDTFALYLGAELQYNPQSPNTTWVEPIQAELKDIDISFKPESKWWRRTVECIQQFKEELDGRALTLGPHLQGGLDCLAALIGPQKLLFDLIGCPDIVKQKLKDVDAALQQVRKALWQIQDSDTWGDMNGFGMHCNGPIDRPQCDFSCMISEEMFDEFQVPALKKELAVLDAAVYHLDGPDALRHTPSVASLKNLQMLQWQPGAGNMDTDWSNHYRRVDALGKGQVFQEFVRLSEADMLDIWRTFTSKQIMFIIDAEQVADIPAFLNSLETVEKQNQC